MYKKILFRGLSALLALAICLSASACGGSGLISDASSQPSESASGTGDPADGGSDASSQEESEPEPEPEVPYYGVRIEEIDLKTAAVTVAPDAEPFTLSVSLSPENASGYTLLWTSSNEAVATVNQLGLVTVVSEGRCLITVSEVHDMTTAKTLVLTVAEPAPPAESSSDDLAALLASAPVVTDVTYINGVLIANKTYALPREYNPGGILPEVMGAFEAMKAAAAAEGVDLYIVSGFRTFDYQQALYSGYVTRNGFASAEAGSARPGHSEHQTGLAFDINTISYAFGETDAGRWVAARGHEYGFIIRYPDGKQAITGYNYEPWHLRYLGVPTATAVYQSGLCLEEFLGITSVYSY